jgi:SAM-dependent methyltransferase
MGPSIKEDFMNLKRRLKSAARGFLNPDRVMPIAAASNWKQIQADKEAWKDELPRWERLHKLALTILAEAGCQSGTMLEIGGRRNPRKKDFSQFTYHALDLKDAPGAEVKVAVGDITHCPHIPDESYDFIFSLDVFEHIDKPWLAASEIQRLLKPGGVTLHSTLFSWRYHPCPIDYWRYSPSGLESLFNGLDCLYADFDFAERRRDLRGRDGNIIECDSLGGWRENVRVNYAGIKPK